MHIIFSIDTIGVTMFDKNFNLIAEREGFKSQSSAQRSANRVLKNNGFALVWFYSKSPDGLFKLVPLGFLDASDAT